LEAQETATSQGYTLRWASTYTKVANIVQESSQFHSVFPHDNI
jgi:hypothetical protein